MDKRKLLPLGLVIILLVVWKLQNDSHSSGFITLTGTTMGPIVYNIKYLGDTNYQVAIDSLLEAFNQSLSTYIPDSEISRFNENDSLAFQSPFFYPILELSKDIHQLTEGAFDPTLGPLINAWGFGPNRNRDPENINIDSLKRLVGFSKIRFDENKIIKEERGMSLDFSAVAKGYAVDLVSQFLEDNDVDDYMVEIGGEVRCSGQNPSGKIWRIGIENPTVAPGEQELFATTVVENRSLATSGNYRNFYEVDGKKYAHTISPFTGAPVEHSLLSASVFSVSCMAADALATGFMVLGLEKSIEIVENSRDIEAYLIYADEDGTLQTYSSRGVKTEVE